MIRPVNSLHARVERLLANPRFPSRFAPIFQGFFGAYRAALTDAGLNPAPHDHLLITLVDKLEEQLDCHFTFEPYHEQITAPFDHYQFGVEFLRPLVDASRSSV